MSNKFCPNLNLPEAKALIEKVGLIGFYREYIKNNYQIPDSSNYKTKVKEGVDSVFEQYPELSEIGTEQQYSQYLDTIFPDSQVKDIVYHFTTKENKEKILEQGFKINKPRESDISFSKDNTWKDDYRNETVYSLLNIKNPKGYDRYSLTEKRELDPTVDGGINIKTSDTHYATVVFEPEQIHILGSKQDIQGFKEFVDTKILEDLLEIPETRTVEDIVFVNKELFDAHQQDTIIDSFIYQIRTGQNSNLTNNQIKSKFFRELQETENYFRHVEEDIELADHYKAVIDNYENFYDRGLKRLESRGVKLTPVLNSEDVDYGLDDAEYDYEGATYQKLNYSDDATFLQSSKDTASSHIKIALSLIPKYQIENGKVVRDEDGNFEEELNYLGLPQYENMDMIWNDLLYTLIDVPIGEKLDYLRDSDNPKHNIIYDIITSDPNSQIQDEFESTFSKQQAKFVTVLISRPSGGFKTISVIDTNRNNAENLLIDDWYNDFLQSNLVTTDKEGNRRVNTELGKQIQTNFNEAVLQLRDNPDVGAKAVRKVFKSIGIDLSLAAIKTDSIKVGRDEITPLEIIRNNGKYIFDRLAGNLDKGTETIEDTLEANNPFITEDKALNLIAKLENTVNPSVFEASMISGDGKAKYSFVNNTFLSHRFRELTTNKAYAEQKLQTDYASGSYYLKQLAGANRDNFIHNFGLHYLDTLGNSASNQTNKPFARMNTREKEYTRVSLFQNGGKDTSYFMSLIPSDKTTMPVFKVPRINIKNYSKAKTVDSQTKRILLDQFMSEYNRVKRVIEQNNDDSITKIANYHGKNGLGTRFIVFPFMNKIMFENGVLLDAAPSNIEEQAWPEIEKFINQLVTDQVNYWTELGINDNSIFDKSYSAKNTNNIEDLAANYAINNFIFLHNQTQLFSGDPALHGKLTKQDREKGIITNEGSVAQTWINYYKRMAKDIAPGLDGNFGQGAKFNTVFLKDLEYVSNHLNEYLEKVGGHLSKAYSEINPADAQEYTTLDEHLKVMTAYGRITKEQKDAVERLKKGSADPNDISLILQPMKPVYVASKIENGIEVMYYIKTSSFPLIPALTKGLEIDKLRVVMEKQGVDRAVYESGVKLGIQGELTNVSNNGGTTFNNISFDEGQIINLDRSGFRIQQELPYHGLHGSINEGSQGRKLVLSNVSNDDVYNYNNQKYTGKELKDIYEQLHIEKMDRAWDSLLDEIKFNKETGRIEDLGALANILKEEAETRDYPVNDIYSIQLVEHNGVMKFKVPLGFTNNSTRFESILNSLVTNRVIKSELPGFTAVQAAGSGFTRVTSDERIADYESVITWVNPEETELNYIREENGQLVSADILVPNYFKGINLKDYVVGGYLDMNAIPEDLLTLIGQRIPTQGKNSMMKFRVKGFLPSYMGELAVVPAEITAQMGSDFDVDKLFLYRYNYKQDKNGNLTKVTTYLGDTAGDIDYSKLSKEQIDNLIVQMFEDILSDTRFYDEIIEPNGFGKLPEVADEVSKLLKVNQGPHTFSPRSQNSIYEVNADGKMGTAIFSLYSTFYRTAQDVGLGLIMPLKFKDENGQVVELSSLSEQRAIDGNKRSNVIMYFQSAAVDNAKEQVLGKLNINEYTMNEAGVMAMLGLPEDFIGYFMSQPAIREYVSRVAQNGDIIDGEFDPNINNKTLYDLLTQYTGNPRGMNDLEVSRLMSKLDSVTYSSKDLLDGLSRDQESTLPSTLTAEEQQLLSAVNDVLQTKVLLDFIRIQEIAGAVRVLQSAVNIDTKGLGSNLITVENKYNQFVQLNKAFRTSDYPLFNAEKIFTSTVAGRAQTILKDTRNMYAQILPYATPSYSSVIRGIYDSVGLNETEENLRVITSNLKSYILSSREFIGDDVDYVADSLLYSDNNIAKRWDEYSKTDKGKANPLTKRIKSRPAERKNDYNGLKALNTPASNAKSDIDNTITYFYDMLNSSDANERRLAEDMVKYHIITGAQYGPNSIGKYITYDVLEKNEFSRKMRDINDSLYMGGLDLVGFYDQFFINNPFKAKSVNFKLSGDKVTIARKGTGILTNGGLAAGYIVSYNTGTREPSLYKLIGKGAKDTLVYGKLPVNQANKLVKRYNFEQGTVLQANDVPVKEDNPVQLAQEAPNRTDRQQILSNSYNLASNDISEVLNRILDKTNSEYKINIINDLLSSINNFENIDIEVSDSRPESNGWYSENTNTIYLNLNKISQFANPSAKLEEVFLHELLHGATVNLLSAEDQYLTAKQKTARNKINRLYNEYTKAYPNQELLDKYKELYAKQDRTADETDFLRQYKAELYPLLNVEEFIAAGLTSEDFRNTLKANNFWTRLMDLISTLLGVNTNDLDVLYTSTVELISDAPATQESTDDIQTFEDFSEINDEELARQEFVKQRDEFFRAYNIKNYWNDFGKKYTAESQKRLLGANLNPKYDRVKVWFWNNELRLTHIDPRAEIAGTHFDIADKSQEDTLIDRMIRNFEGRLKTAEYRRRSLGDEVDPKLDLEIQRIRDRINTLKNDKSVKNIYDVASAKMNEIEETLEGTVDKDDLKEISAYLNEFLIINDQVDFDTGDELGAKYSKMFNELAGRASNLKKRWHEKAIEALERAGEYHLDMHPEKFGIRSIATEGVREVGVLESATLDFSQSSSNHIQNIGYLIERAQYDANERYNNRTAELNQIVKEYVDKYGNDFTQLLQTDKNGKVNGFLINKYQDKYYKEAKKSKKFWRENATAVITPEQEALFEQHREEYADTYKNNINEYNVWLANNDPHIWINNFNNTGKFDRDSPALRYVKIQPSDKWIDPKYTALKAKGEDDPAVKFYNYIEPILRQANRKYNQQVNYIPEVQLSAMEMFVKGKFKGGIRNLWNDFAIQADEAVEDDRNQEDKNKDIDIDSITNEPRQYIRKKMFNNRLSPEDKSYDLGRIVAAVMHQEETIKSKYEIEPLLNIYYAMLKDAKAKIKIGSEEATVDRNAARLTEQARFLIDNWVYDKSRDTGESEKKYGQVTDAVISYIRTKGMGWNPFSAIGNITQSLTSNMIFASGSNQYFTMNDYLQSLGENLHQLAGSKKKADKISKAFRFTDAFVLSNELNFGKDSQLKQSSRGKFESYVEPFFLTAKAEYFNQGQTMVAVLKNMKTKNLKGEEVAVWDAFDDNFNWKTEEFGENPYKEGSTEKFKLQSRIRKAIIDIHGNYARPIQIKKHFWARAMMIFRTWLPQMINNRFGGHTEDHFLNISTKGRYMTVIDGSFFKNKDGKVDLTAAKQNLLWLLKLSGDTELSDIDKTNMRKNLSELLLLAALTAFIMIGKSILDDDDEDKEFTTYVLNSMFRAQADLTMFLSPESWDTVIKDPIPAMSVIRDTFDTMGAAWDTINGEGTYKSGYRKGKSKLFKEAIDWIPGFTQVDKNWSYMKQSFGDYNR